MKKYIAIALLIVLGTVYPAYARWSVGTAGGGVAAAGGGESCNATPFQGSLTTNACNSDVTLAYDANDYYRGTVFTASATKCVCQIQVRLCGDTGDASGFNYVARLWTMSGNNLNTELGASTAVTGVTGAEATYNFNFSSCVNISSATVYGITLDRGTVGSAAYVDLGMNTNTIANWGMNRWDSSKEAPGEAGTADPGMVLHAYE